MWLNPILVWTTLFHNPYYYLFDSIILLKGARYCMYYLVTHSLHETLFTFCVRQGESGVWVSCACASCPLWHGLTNQHHASNKSCLLPLTQPTIMLCYVSYCDIFIHLHLSLLQVFGGCFSFCFSTLENWHPGTYSHDQSCMSFYSYFDIERLLALISRKSYNSNNFVLVYPYFYHIILFC